MRGKDLSAGGAGGPSLQGYEYQIDVSVWLALDIVLSAKMAEELVLEPASQEDIEADLKEFEPGRVVSHAAVADYRLVVQVKRRTGDAWTISGITRLLKHGSAGRQSAAKRLSDTRARYLLVTSAPLNGVAARLGVLRPGAWPAQPVPKSLAKAFTNNADGRVGIVARLDDELLGFRLRQLLTDGFRVPNARWEECRDTLRNEARIRIMGGGSGRWERRDIERVIRDCEGYIASSPELELFVYPSNWSDLKSAMSTRYGAIIVGQSGTGKTIATKKLYDELRHSIPGLSRRPITLGPGQLRDDQTEPPVLYDVEDPWGRFDFEPDSRPWNEQMAGLLAKARPDRMIVATSRRDVAERSGAYDAIRPWVISLEAEHYGPQQRRRLYQNRIDSLPRELQILAGPSERRVLAELATPLEIQKFFDALPLLDRTLASDPAKFISEAVSRAHQDSIERTVIDQIEGQDNVPAAAVIWGLLKVSDRFSLRALRQIEPSLVDADPRLSEGVSPLVQFFVAARNLRQTESAVSYYHPRVESGIERAMQRHPFLAAKTLRHLVGVLTSMEPATTGEWGIGTAARLMAGVSRFDHIRPKLQPEVQKKIDLWIEEKLNAGGPDFASMLRIAASAGSPASAPSEVARFLLHRPEHPSFGIVSWESPDNDESWYARMRADVSTRRILDMFIRDVLPLESDEFPGSFADEVARLAPDLADAFLSAAMTVVRFGYITTDDAILAGALKDLDAFETVVTASVLALSPSETEMRERAETHLAIVNGEYSEDYVEHLADNDDGYTAEQFLKAYVRRARVLSGWQRIADHTHLDHLLRHWLDALSDEALPPSEEVAAVFSASCGGKREDQLWRLLLKHWSSQYEVPLVRRMIEGSPDPSVRLSALTCVIEHAPHQIVEVSSALLTAGRGRQLAEIAIELGMLRHERSPVDHEDHSSAASSAAALLPVNYMELSDAAVAVRARKQPALSDETRTVLLSIVEPSEEIRAFRVELDEYISLSVADDVKQLLAETNESFIAVNAIAAAIRHKLTTEFDAALHHRFSHVRARALAALGESQEAPLPVFMLGYATAKGYPVRKALVDLLSAKPHEEHVPALLQLANDQWSPRATYYDDRSDYPIAKAAVHALERLGPLAAETVDALYKVAIETQDVDLRMEALSLIAKAGGSSGRARLLAVCIAPGRINQRSAAANALLRNAGQVEEELLMQITPEIIRTIAARVACTLVRLLSLAADPPTVKRMAETLSADSRRRVLLLLMAWVVKDRDLALAKSVTGLLPTQHPAIEWALGGASPDMTDEVLDDLGDAATVAEVLPFVKPRKAETDAVDLH